MIGDIEADALRVLLYSGVAGSGIQLPQQGTLCNFPGKGVFPPPRADEKHVTFGHPAAFSNGSVICLEEKTGIDVLVYRLAI
jgi:hypothetical protein